MIYEKRTPKQAIKGTHSGSVSDRDNKKKNHLIEEIEKFRRMKGVYGRKIDLGLKDITL